VWCDPTGKGQTKADGQAVQKLPQAFFDAWAKHDGHGLAKMMAGDLDFVTDATTYLPASPTFKRFYVRLLGGRFNDRTITRGVSCVRVGVVR
jgi:uncharacterized protein (TIGR02246 family)